MIFVWTVGDVIGLSVLALGIVWALCLWVPIAWRQARCKHDGTVSETRACDAICDKCGANLGFIRTWREKQQSPKLHSEK